jgi:hypothetical protein
LWKSKTNTKAVRETVIEPSGCRKGLTKGCGKSCTRQHMPIQTRPDSLRMYQNRKVSPHHSTEINGSTEITCKRVICILSCTLQFACASNYPEPTSRNPPGFNPRVIIERQVFPRIIAHLVSIFAYMHPKYIEAHKQESDIKRRPPEPTTPTQCRIQNRV